MARIDPAVTFALNVPDDPIAVWNAAFRKLGTGLRDVINRVVERLPAEEWTVRDDENPKTRHRVKLKAKGTTADELGLKFALIAAKIPGGGQLLIDEGRRLSLGQPRGPKVGRKKSLDDMGDGRSLDGAVDDVNAPGRLGVAHASDPFHGLDAPDVMDEGIWRAFGQPTAGGYIRELQAASLDEFGPGEAPRSLAPVVVAAIIGACVTALVALVPVVLPMVTEAGGRFIDTLKETGGDVGKAAEEALKSPEKRAEEAAAVADEQAKKDTMTTILLAGGAIVAVVIVIVIARKMGGG